MSSISDVPQYYERHEFTNFPLCIGKSVADVKFVDSSYYTNSLNNALKLIIIDSYGNIEIDTRKLRNRQVRKELTKEEIGSGGYGIVYKFEIDGAQFVIKQTQDLHELNIIDRLMNLNNGELFYTCRIIPARKTIFTVDPAPFYKSVDSMYSGFCSKGDEKENNLIKKQFCEDISETIKKFKKKYKPNKLIYFTLLPLMDGSLANLFKIDENKRPLFLNLSDFQKVSIVKIITDYIYCLYQNDYYYTDIKFENVLYKCLGENHILLFLGDLGSIFKKNEGCVSTFPPFGNYSLADTDSLTIIWAIHIMLMSLINEKLDEFVGDNYNKPEKFTNFNNIRDFIITNTSNTLDIIVQFLINNFEYLYSVKTKRFTEYKYELDILYKEVLKSVNKKCIVM